MEDNDSLFLCISTLTYDALVLVELAIVSLMITLFIFKLIVRKLISFILDTVAQVNCVSDHVLKWIGHDLHSFIPTKNKLTTYTGQNSCLRILFFTKVWGVFLYFHTVISYCTCILVLEARKKLYLIRKVDTFDQLNVVSLVMRIIASLTFLMKVPNWYNRFWLS